MSSGTMCAVPGCGFHASAMSPYCSKHKKEIETSPEEKAAEAARFAEAAAAANAAFREAAYWAVPTGKGGDKRYLVLGATPHEERRGRTHYDRHDVYLLDNVAPTHSEIDYSRYIQADYGPAHVYSLRGISDKHKKEFDEIAFDYSTLKNFSPGNGLLTTRLECFRNMLKDDGILYIPDNIKEYERELNSAGFEAKEVRVRDILGNGNTLPDILYAGVIRDDRTIFVAKKRDRYGGKRRNTHRQTKRSHKSRKMSIRHRKISGRQAF